MAEWQVINGDCMEVLKTMAPGSIDAVVTDPPYGVELKAKKAKQRDGGTKIRQGSYSFADTPEYVRDVVVPVIELCRKIARVVVVTPGTRNLWLYPPATEIGCFYSSAATGIGRWGFSCFQPILYYGKDPYLPKGAKQNSCGQTYPNDANKVDHPCAKPIRWARWLVERATLPGWTILDPFMGSGTTGVACYRTRRRFIGIEINPEYCALAEHRLREAENETPLFRNLSPES